jgi:iron complex transport system ATP-binding protein
MLEAKEVSFSAGGKRILDRVSVGVRPSETLAIVGPNGAGKSTLLRLLCGFDLNPESGHILVDGRELSSFTPRAMARRRAVLSQEQELRADFPAFDVVLLGRTPHAGRGETPRDYEIAQSAIEEVRAGHLAETAYTVLSGGEKQRVALARGAAQIWESVPEQARYFLLDEPTNNLDLEHKHRLLRTARRWAEEGIGVVLVLHDLNLAARYADRILAMQEGRVVADGPPNEVLTESLMQSVFRTQARVQKHPCYNCPLVISLDAAEPEEEHKKESLR